MGWERKETEGGDDVRDEADSNAGLSLHAVDERANAMHGRVKQSARNGGVRDVDGENKGRRLRRARLHCDRRAVVDRAIRHFRIGAVVAPLSVLVEGADRAARQRVALAA